MIKYLLLIALFCFSFLLRSQEDMQLLFQASWTYPQSGCDVGGPADQIRLTVKNNDGSTPFGEQIYLNYQIDGGPIITDSIPGLTGGATWTFDFVNNTEDFSACDDTFNIVTWVAYANDTIPSNDTFAYQFINSCTIIPGDITGGTTVCQSGNSGSLNHVGYTNGWVSDWEYYNAISGGWASVGNYTDIFNYSNVQYETYYRVIRTSAYCPDATSLTDTIYVDSISIAGVTSGSAVVCSATNGGYIVSNGVYGVIDDWEYNDGSGWISMGAADSVQYTNISTNTSFRYFVTNGVCPQAISDTGTVFLPFPGTLVQSDTICSGPLHSDTLFLIGSVGNVVDWEMDDGSGFLSLGGVTDTFLIISGLTTIMDYRVIIQGGACPQQYSNIITMVVINTPVITVSLDTTIMIGDSAQISGFGGDVWVWSPGLTLVDSNSQSTIAGPVVSTAYIYYGMALNGCVGWDTVTVNVIPPVPPIDSVMITNLITANGDGINDTWNITDVNLMIGTQVKIWNVYGQEIYGNDNYLNEWDGTYKGKSLPNGTYYYWVRLGVYDNEYKGTITIVGDE